jgi:hypothetical protein
LITAGLLKEVWLHLVPVLLEGGTRLFDGEYAVLVGDSTPIAGTATHRLFRVTSP